MVAESHSKRSNLWKLLAIARCLHDIQRSILYASCHCLHPQYSHPNSLGYTQALLHLGNLPKVKLIAQGAKGLHEVCNE